MAADLPTIGANTVLGNATSGTARAVALAVPSCSTATSALIWTANTGFGCNSITGTGTVTNVATGAGLTGGPITTAGTISLAAIAADNVLGNATGGSAVPGAVALTSCSAAQQALTYNTTSHAFGCNTISGSGTVLSGTAGQLAWYPGSANVVASNPSTMLVNGTLTLGVASSTIGQIVLEGSASGAVSITPQAAAGTPTITFGTSSGTPVVTASSPLAITTATGNISVTGVAGEVLGGSGPAFTATPTIGVMGVATGQVNIVGTTSGSTLTFTVDDSTGAWTLKLPTSGGSAGQFLETDGTGVTAWVSPSGSGTVASGIAGQLAYYGSSGTTVSGNTNTSISAGVLTLGQANAAFGKLVLEGSTSGSLTIAPQATAGTPTWTAGTSSGTPVVTASAPLSLTTATGNLVITGAAGQVLAGATPAFTATPTLGASGTVGTVAFGNATSGTVTLGTVTGALGSVTASLPANSGTIAELNLAQAWTAAQTFNIASTIASATAATLDDLNVQAATTTITGNTGSPITKLAKVGIYRPTLTDSSAVTVTDAASFYIDNAPLAAGSVTITNPWSLLVGAGASKLQATTINAALTYGGVTLSNSVTGTGSMVLSTSPTFTTSAIVPLIVGGSGTTGVQLTLQTTSGTGTTDSIAFKGGTNGATTFGTLAAAGLQLTSAGSAAFAVGRQGGSTGPAFSVDASTGTQTAGLKVTGAALNGTVGVVVTDTSGNTNLTINALGSGTIGIGSVSTGVVTITPATTVTGAFTNTNLSAQGATCNSAAGLLSTTATGCAGFVQSGATGGTGLSTAAIGDIIYASATTPTWARLADVATGSVLVSGGVNTAPAWSAAITVTTSVTTAALSGTTSITSPLAIGGSGTTGTQLTFKTTTGNGTTDQFLFEGGNNGGTTFGTWAAAGLQLTSVGSTAFAVGRQGGSTGPAFSVDASAGTQTAGLKITGSALNGTVAVAVTDTSGNTNLTIDAKGSGTIGIAGTSTGAVTVTPATNIIGALTLGTQQTTQGSLVLGNTAAGAFATTVKSSNSASAAWTMTLPTTAGTNLFVLQTDGSGNTSWVAQAGGGSGTVASSTIGQVPVYTAATTVTGGANFTASSGDLTLGQTTGPVGGSVKMFGTTSGNLQLKPAAAAGTNTVMTIPGVTDTLAVLGTAQTFTAAQTWNIASTITSATAAALDDLKVSAATTTITGNTGSPITRLAKTGLYRPTLTDSSAVTVTDAATLYVDNSPLAAGSVTLTNTWSILVGAGNVKFAGTANSVGTITVGTWNGTAIAGLYGGTGLTTAAVGDIIYASATTPTWSRLADVAAGSLLTSGGVNTAPAWSTTATLGASGTVGTLAFGNATSGTVTLGTVTGALGSVTASLPANTGTIAELNLAQTWTATQTFGEVLGTVTSQSGTTYTLAAADCGTEVTFTNAAAVTVTIPATLPVGCNISILQTTAAGQVTVTGTAVTAATLHSAHSYTKTFGQWAIIGINIEANAGGSSAIAILTGDGA